MFLSLPYIVKIPSAEGPLKSLERISYEISTAKAFTFTGNSSFTATFGDSICLYFSNTIKNFSSNMVSLDPPLKNVSITTNHLGILISNTDQDNSYFNTDVTFKVSISPSLQDCYGQFYTETCPITIKMVPKPFSAQIRAHQRGIIVYDPLLLASAGRATFYITSRFYKQLRIVLYKFNVYTDLYKWNQLKV